VPETTFLLIRHGAHVLGHGIIAGRTDVPLSPLGQQQAAGLIERVGHLPIQAIYCSAIPRARETAMPLAQHLRLESHANEALNEIDYGDWTEKHLDDLRPQERWRQWNAFRSGCGVPGGERMLETQSRVVTEMLRLKERHPGEMIALFSHGDPIKSAIAYWLGAPLDLFLRIEISLASVSVVQLGDYGPHVLCVNNTAEIALPGSI
jgi:broad specificity phosphatase PhoE